MAAIRRRPSFFRPTILDLEERAVPASYYVDNAFAGLTAGSTATFNAGQSNAVTGVIIGNNGFATVKDAIAAANATTGVSDSVFLANGTFSIDPTANLGALKVTDALNLVGSGKAVTSIAPASDSFAQSGTDAALITAQGKAFNVSGLTVTGNSKLINTAFRWEGGATGTVLGSGFSNIANAAAGRGIAIVATDAGTIVNVETSGFTNIGSNAVRYNLGATGTVKTSTFVGHGGTLDTDANYGVNVTDGSSALITGNTFTGFSASGPNVSSSAIQVSDGGGAPSTATILGNTLDGNYTGITVGLDATDTSTIDAQYNNFLNNDTTGGLGSAIFASNTAAVITATNNNWGNPNGPGSPSNGGNAASSVNTNDAGNGGAGINFTDAGITQPPGGIAQGTLPVVAATSAANYVAQVAPTLAVTGPVPGTSSPITLTFQFSKPVTGFTASDVTFTGAVGTPVVQSVTDLGNGKYSVVVGGLNKRGTLVVNVAQGQTTDNIGFGNQASSSNVAFQPPFDVGYGTSADAGIVTPTFGVVENTSTTRFGTAAFGASFTGGVRTATADVTGDGTLDYIVASGPGRQAEVRVFDGATETQIFSFVPFGSTFTRGAYVSAGDLNGDGKAEIAITAERGGGARIRILSGGTFTQIADFIGIIGSNGVPDTNFRGGARSAIGDFNGDGTADLAFAAGTGGGPRIALFDGKTIATTRAKLTADFFVFESTLRDGSNIAAGDVNGDGKADLIAGAGNGAARVRVFSGATLISTGGVGTQTSFVDYFAFGSAGSTGVRVAARDLDLDGKADVIAAPGTGAGGSIREYNANALIANPGSPAVSLTLNLYGSFTGGVFVG